MPRPHIIVEVREGTVVSVQTDNPADVWIVDWDSEQIGRRASVDKPELEMLQPEALAEILEQTGEDLSDN